MRRAAAAPSVGDIDEGDDMNPESHRLYHREREADTARRLGHDDLARAVRRPPTTRRLLLRILARLRNRTLSEGAPESPPAGAPR